MAITKRLVELMNGEIAVRSEKGAGTEITVSVTLRTAERSGGEAEGTLDITAPRGPSGRKRNAPAKTHAAKIQVEKSGNVWYNFLD